MNTLTIGPFLTAEQASNSANSKIVPLGFQLEWATALQAVAIPVFRHVTEHAPNRLRLQNVVFASAQLPFDLECSEPQVVDTPNGTYLPLEALLSQLYSSYEVGRSIFAVLTELAELMPLSGSVRRPIAAPGLLIPEAEQKGFVLNSVVRNGKQIFAEIGWRPPNQGYVFHTCICDFAHGQAQNGDEGTWKPTCLTGVHQPLARELRVLAPGKPGTLFTPYGLRVVQDHSLG